MRYFKKRTSEAAVREDRAALQGDRLPLTAEMGGTAARCPRHVSPIAASVTGQVTPPLDAGGRGTAALRTHVKAGESNSAPAPARPLRPGRQLLHNS